ncbi:MAG: Dabb family protein [Planctomycetota bacterium]
MLNHTVLFWLKPSLSADSVKAFQKGLETLKQIPDVESIVVGRPSATDRPVIDRSYDFGLNVIFKSMEQHDRYQVHAVHKKFLEMFSASWKKVLVYDFE